MQLWGMIRARNYHLYAITVGFATMATVIPAVPVQAQSAPSSPPSSATTDRSAEQPAPPRQPMPDEVARGDTVTGRPRPDYDAAGIRVGGFMLFPELAVQEAYNSNIYATENNTKSDYITTVAPSLDLRSNWNNHALRLHADSTLTRYADHQSENSTDYTLLSDGRLDVLHDLRLYGGASYAKRHEARSSPDNQGGSEPTEYSIYSANAAVEKVFDRVAMRLDAKGDRYVFSDVPSTGGGTIDESGRDRNQGELALRTSYELAPLRNVYMQGSVNTRKYDNSRDASGYARSSDGYGLVVGTQYDLTGITFIDVFAGWRQQDYDDARLKTMSGWTAGAKLTWNVTRLTTVTADLTRDIEETTLAGASGYFATRTGLRADHELLRNLLLNARLGYEQDSFDGIGRDDDYYSAGLGAKYLIDRNFALSGGYTYRTRDSSAANSDFVENVVFLRLSSHI